MRKLQILVLVTALSANACARGQRAPHVRTHLSRTEFVAVMVELGRAQPHQRQIILNKHHTSDAEIREFVQKYSPYPEALSTTFDTIQARLQRGPSRSGL